MIPRGASPALPVTALGILLLLWVGPSTPRLRSTGPPCAPAKEPTSSPGSGSAPPNGIPLRQAIEKNT